MTEKVALLTDSTCDLGQEIIERFSIQVLPLKVVYKDREYNDRVDITPEEVYGRLEQEVPTTSMPSPFEVRKMLEGLKSEGFTHVLAVHISSGLSGTSSMIAAIAREIRGLKTEVIDSRSLSMGLGFVVEQAARWIDERLDFESLVTRTKGMVDRTRAFYVLKTLEYLRRGGRIGAVSAALGGLLDLKPIISIDEQGRYFTYRKVRGRRQSIDELYSIARELIEAGKTRVAVMHSNAVEEATALLERLKQLGKAEEFHLGQISPVMGVHTGPGLVGIVVTG